MRRGAVKRLSPSRCLFVVKWHTALSKNINCLAVRPAVFFDDKHIQLTIGALLENRHEIALYRSASQFIFFERCLESQTSLLSSAMAMDF